MEKIIEAIEAKLKTKMEESINEERMRVVAEIFSSDVASTPKQDGK